MNLALEKLSEAGEQRQTATHTASQSVTESHQGGPAAPHREQHTHLQAACVFRQCGMRQFFAARAPRGARAGVEVACNLLDCGVTPPARVEAAVRRLAGEAGGTMAAPYTTGRTQQELVDLVQAAAAAR